MPFQSEKQRKYLHANHPEIANRWEAKYGLGGIAELNSQLNSLPEYYLPKNQGGRIGFDSGSNGITLGSDRYNITLEPGASGSWTSQDLGHGYNVGQKNISYGVDTTANVGPVEIGIDFKNFLDKFDVTKDGTTVEKDTQKDKQIAYSLGLNLEDLYAKIDSDEEFENWYFTIRKTFSGGGTPAHEAGIYGLEDGGRTGFRRGTSGAPGGGDPGMTSDSSGAGQTHSGGDRGYQNVHQTGAVTQTPGRTPDPAPDPDRGWQTYAIEDPKKIKPPDEDKESKVKDWVTTETKKVPKFTANLALANKLNIPFLAASSVTDYILGKFKNRKQDKTLGLTDSINFGQGLGDDEKVLGDIDFSEIEGQEAKLTGLALAQMRVLQKKQATEQMNKELGIEGEKFTPKDQKFLDKLREMDKEEKVYSMPIVTAAQGGIAGLKQGGRIGFFTGQRAEEQEAQSTGAGYQSVHDTGAVSQTPGRTPREVPPGEIGGPGYVSPEDLQTLKITDFVNKQEDDWGKYDNPLDKYSYTTPGTKKRRTFLEKQALDNWNAVKDTANTWAKKKAGKAVFDHFLLGGATLGLGDVIGGLIQGFKTNKAKQEFINVIKGSIAAYQEKGLPEYSPHTDTLIQDLNQQLLDLTQTRDRPDQGPDGGDGITGVASITYDDIEDTNQKNRASAEANTILEDARNAKRDAYLAAFRQKYLMGDTEKAAHGGRIPGGYNTGGLSNLFRLKNV